MDDVQRIGQSPQRRARPVHPRRAAGMRAQQDQRRKPQHDDQRLEQAVHGGMPGRAHHQALAIAMPRRPDHRQGKHDHQHQPQWHDADPPSRQPVDHPIEQQSGDERKGQPHRRHPETIPAKALGQCAIVHAAIDQQSPRRQQQRGQCPKREPTQHQRIGDIAEILLKQRPRRPVERMGVIAPFRQSAPGQHQHPGEECDRQLTRARRRRWAMPGADQIGRQPLDHRDDHHGV